MSPASAADVTRHLLAWREGDGQALDRLLPLVYSELRVIAHARMRGEAPGDQTLQATALVNEAYLRLIDVQRVNLAEPDSLPGPCPRD